MQSKERRVYVNAKQVQFLNARQKRRSFVGGRGSGKSTVYGHVQYQRFNYLPRAKVFTAGLTYNQILTKTLPSAMDAWDALGLREYDKKTGLGHFVVGVKPPSDWLKPYQAPRNYENAITFLNGFTIEMLSMDRPDSNRGGNYDGGDCDESALLKEDQVNKVLMPMIRGNIYRFNHFMHQSFFDYTSSPWLPSGQWVFKTQELAKEEPDNYLYIESTAYDNVAVLGADYLSKLKKQMTKLEWDVEVMNKRLTKLPNSFYPAFNDERHLNFKTFSYDQDEETGLWTTGNSFYNSKQPIETSWDFNAAFTSMIVCQDRGNEYRIINELYIEEDTEVSKVDALTDLFIKEYENHLCKEVFIYGDRNGNNKSPGDTKTFYEKIMDRLRQKGWEPTLMVQGLDPDHLLKHIFINDMLSEKNKSWPVIRMDQNRCKWLPISITNSPIKPDYRKDKSSERLLIDQKRTTHLSDCFDNIIYRKFSHLANQAPDTYQVYFLGRG